MLRNYLTGVSVLTILVVGAGWTITSAQENAPPAAENKAETVPPELLGAWNIALGDPAERTLPCWMSIEQKDGKLTARYNSWAAGMQYIPVEFKDGKISFACWTPGIKGKDFWTGTLKLQERPGRQGRRAGQLNATIEGTARGENDEKTRPWTARRQVIRVNTTGTWIIENVEGLPKTERKLLLKQENWRVQGRLIDGEHGEKLADSRLRGGELTATVPMRGAGQETVQFNLKATIKGDILDGAFIDGEKQYPFTARRERQWESPIQLFNGENLDGWTVKAWEKRDGFNWQVTDGALCTPKPGKDIVTERKFDDFKLRLEFKVPPGGNSGVYLRGRHEVQVADSFGKPLSPDCCGAVYGRIIPSVNACKKPDEWQSYEITLIGMYLTVKFNDQIIIDNQLLEGMTGGALDNDDNEPGPIYLQGDHSAICYRNIQITPAKAPVPPEGLE